MSEQGMKYPQTKGQRTNVSFVSESVTAVATERFDRF